jgi:hypothetical protein
MTLLSLSTSGGGWVAEGLNINYPWKTGFFSLDLLTRTKRNYLLKIHLKRRAFFWERREGGRLEVWKKMGGGRRGRKSREKKAEKNRWQRRRK